MHLFQRFMEPKDDAGIDRERSTKSLLGLLALDPERVIQHSPGSRSAPWGSETPGSSTLKGLHKTKRMHQCRNHWPNSICISYSLRRTAFPFFEKTCERPFACLSGRHLQESR